MIIGDDPNMKFGCDDITVVICFMSFLADEEI